jgi:hypothetical protein
MKIRKMLFCLFTALFFWGTVPNSLALCAEKTTVLEDKQGRVLGKIKTLPNGKLELRDKQGCVVGRYDPKANKTKDKQGRVVGKGNLLPMLIR